MQQVRELEIHTRRVLNSSQVGGYRSSQKGFGFDFDQLRPYQYGDDVRLIDWKSSCRGNNLLVRQYFEERNRTFMLCLDVSASTYYGSHDTLKQDVMKQITGVLSLVAEFSKDKVGLILFSDQIEKEIAPAKGKQHVHHIIETIFSHVPSSKKTDINVLLGHVTQKVSKSAVVFLISDFISPCFEKSLKQVAIHKEVIAVSCTDAQEIDFDSAGLLWIQDPETGEQVLVDTRKKKRQDLSAFLQKRMMQQRQMFQQYKVDFLQVQPKAHFIHDLVMFFQKRLMY